MTSYDRFKFDSHIGVESPEGYIFPVTLSASMVYDYEAGKALKPPSALLYAVKEAASNWRDIPVTLEHPRPAMDGWAARATVGKILPGSLHYDFAANKVRGEALIYRDNAWVADLIARGQDNGVSIGFESKEDFTPGEYNGAHYDFIMNDITLDHLAISLMSEPRCPNGTCGFFADAKHTDPEVTEEYVRIPVAEPTGETRTITISPEKGIKALISISGGASKVITYLFDKAKWTMESAKDWITAHKPNASNADTKAEETKMVEEKKSEVKVDAEKPAETKPKDEPEDCSKKLDSLIAEYEQKIKTLSASSDAKIAEIRAEFQTKFDSLIEAKKPVEVKVEPKVDAAPPATGEKCVKPSCDTASNIDIEALKAKRQSKYMFKTDKVSN